MIFPPIPADLSRISRPAGAIFRLVEAAPQEISTATDPFTAKSAGPADASAAAGVRCDAASTAARERLAQSPGGRQAARRGLRTSG
jgi:hypothetical protein